MEKDTLAIALIILGVLLEIFVVVVITYRSLNKQKEDFKNYQSFKKRKEVKDLYDPENDYKKSERVFNSLSEIERENKYYLKTLTSAINKMDQAIKRKVYTRR